MKKEAIAKFYLSYRLYIFPAIVAFSSLILIVFVIFPQIIVLISNQKDEGKLRNRSKVLEVKAQTLESYNAQDISNKLNYALSSYPDGKDFGNVVGLIQNISSQSGFSATSISIGTSVNKLPNTQSYSLKLDISGPKSLFYILLSNIEKSSRLMRVSNIEVTNFQDKQTVNASLSLDILFAPLPNNSGNTDSPLPEISQKDQELLAKLASNAVSSIPSATNTILPPRGKANPFE